MFKGFFKKADFILMAVLILFGIVGSILVSSAQGLGDKVTITVDGELYGTYSLSEDREIRVENGKKKNLVVIENHTVKMESANCKNGVCVNHKPIAASGQSIICLPNRVVVSVEGKEKKYDAVSK